MSDFVVGVISMVSGVYGRRAGLAFAALMVTVMMLDGAAASAMVGQGGVCGLETAAPGLAASTAYFVERGGGAGRAGGSDGGYAILTTAAESDSFYSVVLALHDYRGGDIIHFDPEDLGSLLALLKDASPRYAAVVLPAVELTQNFARKFLMMSTCVDDDPFCDFSFGYITGGTAQDALNFVNNIKKAEAMGVQQFPLNITSVGISNGNFFFQYAYGYEKYLNPSCTGIYLNGSEDGGGLSFFDSKKQYLANSKLIEMSGHGDPHRLVMFDLDKLDPPVWPYDPSEVEKPSNARNGLSSYNISALNLFPAVVFNGACYGGTPKVVKVDSMLKYTFGDTGGKIRFYEMSDDFSLALSVLKSNATGYFASIGPDHGSQNSLDIYNCFRTNAPLGDVHRDAINELVMGFMGNRPSLKTYQEGEVDNSYEDQVFASGTFDPADWQWGSKVMLVNRANRIYFGDPLYNPYAKNHSDKLNITKTTISKINASSLVLNMTFNTKDDPGACPTWDMYHESGTRVYAPFELPAGYENISKLEVLGASSAYDYVINATEKSGNKTILHLEVDIPDDSYDPISFSISFRITVPEEPRYGVDILGSDAARTAKPNETVSYQFRVLNTGNRMDSFLLEHDAPPQGWGLSVSPLEGAYGPGTVGNVTVSVTPPATALAGDNWTILLTAGSAGNASLSDTVSFATTVGAVRGLAISGGNQSGTVLPGMNCSFTVMVSNTGNAKDSFTLELTQPSSPGWTASLGEFDASEMPPSGQSSAVVTMTCPKGALSGSSCSVYLTATSQSDPSVTGTVLLTAVAGDRFGVRLASTNLSDGLNPGQNRTFQVTVENAGNARDSFSLSANAPPGWSADISFNGTGIPQGGKRTASVTVKVPDNAPAADRVSIPLEAASAGDSGASAGLEIAIRVRQVPGASITVPANASARPGETVTYTFQLRNAGNGNDSFTLSSKASRSWPVRLVEERVLAVGPGEERDVTVEMTVPPFTPDNTTTGLELIAVSEAGLGARYASSKVTTTVLPVYSVELQSPSSGQKVYAGKTVTFTIIITNRGNKAGPVALEIQGKFKDWATLSESAPVVKMNESKSVLLTVKAGKVAGVTSFAVKAASGDASGTLNLTVDVSVADNITRDDGWQLPAGAVAAAGVAMAAAFVLLRKRRRGPPSPNASSEAQYPHAGAQQQEPAGWNNGGWGQ
jgi:uncharacterized membrane protein